MVIYKCSIIYCGGNLKIKDLFQTIGYNVDAFINHTGTIKKLHCLVLWDS